MRAMPLALSNYLQSRPRQLIKYELYSFSLPGFGWLRYTDQQFDVSILQPSDGSVLTWVSDDVFVNFIGKDTGTISKCSLGTDPDSITANIAFRGITDASGSPSLIGSTPWATAIQQRFFDNAYFYRDVVYVLAPGQQPIGRGGLDQYGNLSDGRVNMFTGRISTISKTGGSSTQFTIKDDRVLLDTDYPRNNFQAMCRWTLFGTGCDLIKSSFLNSGTVGPSPSATVIPWTSGKSAGYFSQGTITFTSGAANGQSRQISLDTGSELVLIPKLPSTPSAGDTFDAYPGCDHTLATCTSKFSNAVHFPNYPYVPPPATTI